MERLQCELDQCALALEVNSAKGHMYDELSKHAQKLEQHNRRLVSAEASKSALEQEITAMTGAYQVRYRSQLLSVSVTTLPVSLTVLFLACC